MSNNPSPVGPMAGGLAVGALLSNWVLALLLLALVAVAVLAPVLLACYWLSLAANLGKLDEDGVIWLTVLPVAAMVAVWLHCREEQGHKIEEADFERRLRAIGAEAGESATRPCFNRR